MIATPDTILYGGPCKRCGKDHCLTAADAAPFAYALMDALEQFGHIAFCPEIVAGFAHPENSRDNTNAFGSALDIAFRLDHKEGNDVGHEAMYDIGPTTILPQCLPPEDNRLLTSPLFSEARGQMFGVMVCLAPDGTREVWRAFSGQFNGVWHVDGWVPPLVSEERFLHITTADEERIKAIGREIQRIQKNSLSTGEKMPRAAAGKMANADRPVDNSGENALAEAVRQLKEERATLSRQLMKRIHALYALPDFRGNTLPLTEVFYGKGIPTGTADCCAPKLLANAALRGYTPVSIAEFYWGRTNRSGTREHGRLYPSCTDKCRPILGHMLCGLGDS